MKKLLLLNGPNINLLGKREPDVYGSDTLQTIESIVSKAAGENGFEVDCFQSNHEGELIDQLHEADGKYFGVIFNPAAYTHTSIALHDAIKAIDVPVIEVHISNIYQREVFRHQSMTAPACIGQISGFGIQGYLLAVLAFVNQKES
ncbi:type II 3-dehydroquinate dehydratase [Ornithinibacillus gellani]|uniref:type II 3-dehydroquinate dehydratase n=1 Tax=Ornithinibacillus gellani TaxID=2293253 RepID=UPI000F468C12|nr:type II 3-dehydroquinate dehydratase [Ornithinibacillus gellani]TQS74523.1 type II 3-dehydroquinate dehydratase [Ornithinibacillus gellani]